jgi:hypothetical protein
MADKNCPRDASPLDIGHEIYGNIPYRQVIGMHTSLRAASRSVERKQFAQFAIILCPHCGNGVVPYPAGLSTTVNENKIDRFTHCTSPSFF